MGTGGIKKALEEIGFTNDLERVSNQVNSLSHKDARPQIIELNENDEDLLVEIYNKIQEKYNFIIH